MSKFYPWEERSATIEHGGITLKVTMRRPESCDDDESWDFRAIRAPSSCTTDADSINLVDWMLENLSKTAMDEIQQLALAAIIHEGEAQEEADEEERRDDIAGSMMKMAFTAEAGARAKIAERMGV